MREQFIEKRFTSASRKTIGQVQEILDRYKAQGYDLSLRQLYYQGVAANLWPNSEKSYNNLGALVNDARLAGLLDWQMIKDRGRETVKNSHWDNPVAVQAIMSAGSETVPGN